MKANRIVFTGGGTLGHVMPNIPLIKHYQQAGWEVYYIGSKAGVERKKIEALGVQYHGIRTGKLRRYFDWQNFLDILNVFVAILQAIGLMLRIRPNVLFSKGGYVALPPVIGAGLLRIPVVIHESDMTPGLTTKLSKPFAKKICTAFQDTLRYFPKSKAVYTGLPVRQLVFSASREKGLSYTGFSGKRPILLVFGGSLGAQFLNKICTAQLDKAPFNGFDLVHICGKGNLSSVNKPHYIQYESLEAPFLHIMKSADIVLTRGGATSLFELLGMQKPHVIIPLSKRVSRGDQIENARYFKELGVSTYIEEENYTWDKLVDLLSETLASKQLLEAKMKTLAFDRATESVIEVLNTIAK